MTIHPQEKWSIPEDTKRVALAVFKKGNIYLKIAEQLGQLYEDKEWLDLYKQDGGQSGISPARLALITIFQFLEGLTDRQAAEAVRARIDWKYVLGLELTDEGFDFTVLSEWRKRLIESEKTERLLEILLTHLKGINFLKERGKQRTDSSHVLAAIRKLNRIECVGETIRKVLNDLAYQAPEWLKDKVNQDWFDMYNLKFEKYRFPKNEVEKEELAIRIGEDGYYLLKIVLAPETPKYIKKIESIEILRQVWLQQYYRQGEQVQWREPKILGIPPNQILIQSPIDIEARNRTKRELNPMGETSISWKERKDKSANGAIEIRFSKNTCLFCQSRSLCTKSKQNPRSLKIRPQKEFEILQQLRQQTDTPEFKKLYNQRAGIEGTISQGTRAFSLRRSRYIGLAKTHLQNIAIACAINLTRLVAWFEGIPKESTRTSQFAFLQ